MSILVPSFFSKLFFDSFSEYSLSDMFFLSFKKVFFLKLFYFELSFGSLLQNTTSPNVMSKQRCSFKKTIFRHYIRHLDIFKRKQTKLYQFNSGEFKSHLKWNSLFSWDYSFHKIVKVYYLKKRIMKGKMAEGGGNRKKNADVVYLEMLA